MEKDIISAESQTGSHEGNEEVVQVPNQQEGNVDPVEETKQPTEQMNQSADESDTSVTQMNNTLFPCMAEQEGQQKEPERLCVQEEGACHDDEELKPHHPLTTQIKREVLPHASTMDDIPDASVDEHLKLEVRTHESEVRTHEPSGAHVDSQHEATSALPQVTRHSPIDLSVVRRHLQLAKEPKKELSQSSHTGAAGTTNSVRHLAPAPSLVKLASTPSKEPSSVADGQSSKPVITSSSTRKKSGPRGQAPPYSPPPRHSTDASTFETIAAVVDIDSGGSGEEEEEEEAEKAQDIEEKQKKKSGNDNQIGRSRRRNRRDGKSALSSANSSIKVRNKSNSAPRKQKQPPSETAPLGQHEWYSWPEWGGDWWNEGFCAGDWGSHYTQDAYCFAHDSESKDSVTRSRQNTPASRVGRTGTNLNDSSCNRQNFDGGCKDTQNVSVRSRNAGGSHKRQNPCPQWRVRVKKE